MKAILLLAILHIMIAYKSEKKRNTSRNEPVSQPTVLTNPDKAILFSGLLYGFSWQTQYNKPVLLAPRSWNYLYGSRL